MSDSLITDEATRAEIDSEEDGFHLLLKSEDGQWYDFRIQDIDLDAFYDQVKARIGPYLREMHEARVERVTALVQRVEDGTDALIAGAFRCSPEDVDESGGYALSDPKHENFHSLHADLWDNRDGK